MLVDVVDYLPCYSKAVHALKGDREARDVILEEAMNCNNSYSVQ